MAKQLRSSFIFLLLPSTFLVGGCNFIKEEIEVSCIITEQVSEIAKGERGVKETLPEYGKFFKFYKGRLNESELIETKRMSGDQSISKDKKNDKVWIVEVDGRRIVPANFSSKTNDNQAQSRVIISVDDTFLTYNEFHSGSIGKSKTYSNTQISINRLSGALRGTESELLNEITISSQFYGQCKKAEKKF